MKLGFLTVRLPDRTLEHEDPVWGGTEDRVRTGLEVAFRTLRPLIVA